jgi:hypothetical protein
MYLEIYCNRGGSVNYSITNNNQDAGWTPVDWTAGSIPSGWTSNEYTLSCNFSVCSNTQDLTVLNNGNVGIGTNNPGYKLHVFGNGTTSQIHVNSSGSGKWCQYGLQNDNSTASVGLSAAAGNFSTDAAVGDLIIRNNKSIMLQSGSGASAIYINSSNNVGIGTNNPGQKLHVRGNYYQDNTTHSGRFWTVKGVSGQGGLGFEWAGSNHDKNLNISMHNNSGNFITVGYIENSGSGTWRINDFTGQHRCMPQNNVSADKFGLIVYSTGKYINIDNVNGPTMNNSLPICDLCSIENDVRVFGVISDDRDDNENRTIGYGAFKTYDKKTNTNENRIHINSVGEGGMWVCNKNGNISNGSYISCSIFIIISIIRNNTENSFIIISIT